jgi:hypothetical protein
VRSTLISESRRGATEAAKDLRMGLTLGVRAYEKMPLKLLISARCCRGTTVGAAPCCYVGCTGIPRRGGGATAKITVIRLRIESIGLHHQMTVAPEHPAKRDADRTRPSKSWRQIRLPLRGELGKIELSVLLPLVFVGNVIVATIVWYVVGSLLR